MRKIFHSRFTACAHRTSVDEFLSLDTTGAEMEKLLSIHRFQWKLDQVLRRQMYVCTGEHSPTES